MPLAAAITGASRHGSKLVEQILGRPATVKGRSRGRPQSRPGKQHADKVYDNRRVRRYFRRHEITARIVRIGVNFSRRPKRCRWVVERTKSWLLFRRLAIRYDGSAVAITAVATLAIHHHLHPTTAPEEETKSSLKDVN